MHRRLAITLGRTTAWLLLLPLSFNGVRMVCVEAAALKATVNAEDMAAAPHSPTAEAEEDCATICLREGHGASSPSATTLPHPESPGVRDNAQPTAICFLAPNSLVSCDHVLSFAVAVPVHAITVNANSGQSEVAREAAVSYTSPSPPVWPPPPKA
jgi:hypothetical protein